MAAKTLKQKNFSSSPKAKMNNAHFEPKTNQKEIWQCCKEYYL